MYKRIQEYFKQPIEGKVLGISGIENFHSIISKDAVVIETQYPEVDMQNLPYENNSFNFVISDQVIEHLENPQKAIDESHRVLMKDGIAIHTTCFMNAIHLYPEDYWRFSTDALKYLCKSFSEITQLEGWGNRIAILLCFIGNYFRSMSIPENKWSLKRLIANWNETNYSIVTWVIAKK